MQKYLQLKFKYFVLFLKLCLFLLLVALFYIFFPLSHTAKTFYISSLNIEVITQALQKNGYMLTFLDRLMMQYTTVPTKGWYKIESDTSTRLHFFTTLHQQKTKTMNVVIFGGETAEELTTRLANDMKLDQKKLLKYYKTHTLFFEADIFAGSYTLARKANENETMSHLFEMSRNALLSFAMEYFITVPETIDLKALLTIASIIQKESNDAKEMHHISSVIYNRLEKGMKLQMDSTLNYGKYSRTIVTPERIKIDNSRYNTYKHKGLPLHPLSTVTLEALHAAKHPSKSDYLFFMLSTTGGHNFSETYAEHLDNITKFRIYQKKKRGKKEKRGTTSRE